MTGYVVGKHDDPSDTQDRLVRIGSKYQATAPSVADGDTVYLLVDAAGRPLIVGPAAHDAAAVGNPLRLGGVYRSTLPGVAAADIVDLLMSAEGRPRIEEYLIQQARIGNQKSTQAALGKTTTAEEDITSWTVTNGKTGYLFLCDHRLAVPCQRDPPRHPSLQRHHRGPQVPFWPRRPPVYPYYTNPTQA